MDGSEERLGELLRRLGLTLAVAESCTGGLLGYRITSVPGSSDYFLGGIISYANEVKSAELGVPRGVLAEHGAVSPETAAHMAAGVAGRLGAKVGLSVTGIAGPGGGSARKPVGLVYAGMAREARHAVREFRLSGDREAIRQAAAEQAMQALCGFLEAEGDNNG